VPAYGKFGHLHQYQKEYLYNVKKKKINPFETAYDQYRSLAEKAESTIDIKEKNLIFRRRINLLGVMQFLLAEPNLSNRSSHSH
jgi:hypothetical protein